jgi:dissimilatory sulfite reductase (desulfoviridin) alpha/beta subunit
MMNDPCRFDLPHESCVTVGPATDHLCKYGFGRKIEKRDALKLLEDMAKGGAVHTLFHEKDDTKLPNVAVCNCCWDCCGLYGSFNRGLIPLYFQSHYVAKITDTALCKSCGKCVDHCPTHAVTVQTQGAVVEERKCIGCGQCALQCPTNAIRLERQSRNVLVPLVKPAEARLA